MKMLQLVTISSILVITAYFVVRWILKKPIPPDPWDSELERAR